MSLIIKEVGDAVYVKGGPVCLKCKGTGDWYNARDEGFFDCRECHGTGVLPVEDWPDAVKGEWLKSWLLHHLRINPICPTGDTCEWEWEISNMKTRKSLAINKDFSQALTAAVIAVAKEVAA